MPYIKRIENDPVMRKQYQGYDNYMKRCNAIFNKHGVLVEMRAKNDECYGRIYTLYAKNSPSDYRYKSITSGILPGQCIEQLINYGIYKQMGAANRVVDALRELGYRV